MLSVKSYCEKMISDQLKGILRDCCHGFLDIAEPVLPVMLDILSDRGDLDQATSNMVDDYLKRQAWLREAVRLAKGTGRKR